MLSARWRSLLRFGEYEAIEKLSLIVSDHCLALVHASSQRTRYTLARFGNPCLVNRAVQGPVRSLN